MSILALALVLIVIGAVLWLLNTFVVTDPQGRGVLFAFVAIGVTLWLLKRFGVLSVLHHMRL